MPYRNTYKMLSDQLGDLVLIKSPFQETTRSGAAIRSVLLALTKSKLVIVSREKVKDKPSLYYNKVESLHEFKKVQMTIFKKSLKQALKICFDNDTKYFELAQCKKRKIFWDLWRNHIKEINRGLTTWPFNNTDTFMIKCHYAINSKNGYHLTDSTDEKNEEYDEFPPQRTYGWNDKYLYLGSKMEEEAKHRPVPVAGIGGLEDIKMLYFKPRYLKYYEQTEQWVQCEESFLFNTPYDSNLYDSNIYTYTGEPTSNVTYTSIMTTWK